MPSLNLKALEFIKLNQPRGNGHKRKEENLLLHIAFINSVIAYVLEGSSRRSWWIQQLGPRRDWQQTGRALLVVRPVLRGDRMDRMKSSSLSIGSISSSVSLRWDCHAQKPQPVKQETIFRTIELIGG